MSPRESIEFLITEVAEHDSHGAFRALFHIFFDQVMRFVGMQIKDKHDAEEVAADVFSALWQGRKRLTGVKKLDGYIYSVAWHKIADYRQSQQKKPFTTDDFSLYEGTTTTPETEMMSQELADCLNAAIETLPARCKLVFKLVRENHMPYHDVASTLGISEKTVEAQITIAVKKLRSALRTF